MSRNSQHNADDQDRLLARLLDRDPDKDHSPEAGENVEKHSLYHLLEAYKSKAVLKKHAESHTVPDIRLKPVSAQIRHPHTPSQYNRIFQHYPALLKVAATLFVILFIWLLFYFLKDDLRYELLAESTDSKMEWTFADGSNVILRPYSSLYHIDDTPETDHYRIEGEGYFEVIPDDERVFLVDAGQSRVRVSGTRFSVSTWGEKTRVFLEAGSVIFSHVDGSRQYVLNPGEQITEKQGRISVPEPADPDVRLGWLNNELILNRRTLSDVIPELEHHFNIRVSVASGLKEERVSGTIVLDNPESVLNDLAITVEASTQQISPNYYRIIPLE